MKTIRVLVADDHPLIRQGIKAVLSTCDDIQVVAEASDGEEAVRAYHQHQPDVVLLDVRMPACDGPTAIKRIRESAPQARIIAISHYDGDQDILRCLEAGAATYLLKRSVDDELPQTIRAVEAGHSTLPTEVAARLSASAGKSNLTEREREVLSLLAIGRSNKEIALALKVSVNTVNTHVASILSKLGAEDRTQAARLAVLRGFVHLESDDPGR